MLYRGSAGISCLIQITVATAGPKSKFKREYVIYLCMYDI